MFYCRIDGKSCFLEHGRHLCPKQFGKRDFTGSRNDMENTVFAKQHDVNNGVDMWVPLGKLTYRNQG